jgi:hypothetical protein
VFILPTAPSVIAIAIEEDKGKEGVDELADRCIIVDLCRCMCPIALNISNLQSTSDGVSRDDWLHLQKLQIFHLEMPEIEL